MSELRNIKILEIKNTIEESRYFTLNDFTLDFSPKNGSLVLITFIAYPYFTFSIVENEVRENSKINFPILSGEYKTKNVIQTRECPGDFKEDETKNYIEIDQCIYRISKWIQNLYEDLQNIDVLKSNVDNDAQKMKEKYDKLFNDTEKFTNDEITGLTKLLDDLNLRVNELEKESKLTKEEAKELVVIVEESKKTIRLMPKKAWYITTWNKLRNINDNMKLVLDFQKTISKLIEYSEKIL